MFKRVTSRKCGVLWCLPVVIFLIMLFPMSINASALQTTPEAKEGIDAILLIDSSGSMRYSDSGKVALESAKMFVDMLETSSSRIGIIAFSDSLQAVIPLTPINNNEDKEQIKKTISGFFYNGYTDIGMSLLEAVRHITEDSNAVNSPMILLLTDGNIEINPRNQQRTVEMSQQDVRTALEILGGSVPVYTIGLDNEERVDVELLKTISAKTSGRTYITKDASELPQIFNEIFADHIRSSLTSLLSFIPDGKSYTDVSVQLNNKLISEANITMLSSKRLYDVRLIDPSGQPVVFDGDRYTINHSQQYVMIKITSPMEGEWIVRVKGQYNDQVHVNLINNYNANIAVTLTQEGLSGNLYDPEIPITITAAVTSLNSNYQNMDVSGDAKVDLCIYDNDMNLLSSYPMDNIDGAFASSYIPQGADDIHLAVQVVDKDFIKSSRFYPVSFNPLPIVTEVPPVAPSVETSPVLTSEPVLTPMPTAESPTDSAKEASFPLSAIIGVMTVVITLAAGSVVFIIRCRTGTRVFEGYLEVRAMTQDGVYTSVEAPEISSYVGSKPLDEILSASLSNNGAKILLVPVDTDGIILTPSRRNNRPIIKIKNMSGCEISDDEDNILNKKVILWKENQRLTISNADTETFAKMEITYKTYGFEQAVITDNNDKTLVCPFCCFRFKASDVIASDQTSCPHCHNILPVGYASRDTLLVSVVSGSHSEKTAYLSALVYALQNNTDFMSRLTLINDTVNEKNIHILSYLFYYQYITENIESVETTVNLIFYNSPDGNLREGANIRNSSGVIFLTEPAGLTMPADSMSESVYDNDKSTVPFALTITTSGLLRSEHVHFFDNKPNNRIQNMLDYEPHQGALNMRCIKGIDYEVREYLTFINEEQVLYQAMRYFSSVNCFAVSTLMPSFKIKEPFYWIMMKNRLLTQFENGVYTRYGSVTPEVPNHSARI